MPNTCPEKKSARLRSNLERLAFSATQHIGSFTSLLIHSIFFVGIFALQWLNFGFDQIMLILTTVVSLEAIYLSIFIQMTVNHQAYKLAEVSEDVEDISKDIDDIQEDVEEISEDVEEIGKGDETLTAKRQYNQERIGHIEVILRELLGEVRELKERHK